ncbi:MAG: ThiF family adenylyltransferase [Planctomycetota bacterium]
MPGDPDPLDRFDRQVRFAPLGRAGQERVQAARVLLVGCGALGGVLAQSLARAGVGELVLVDRDIVELSNLPRQVLFDEADARAGRPKALAAAAALARFGGPTRCRAHAVHLDAQNVGELATGADLVLDGTDNLATRYLLNDFCVDHARPWIYAGVVGAAGLVLPVRPGGGACLRCVFPEPPPPGILPTCDTAGVLLPAAGAVASFAAGLALRLLAGPAAAQDLVPALVEIDVWNGEVRRIPAPRDPDCPCCARGERPWLDTPPGTGALALCGRRTVQIPPGPRPPDLEALAQRLAGVATDVVAAGVLLRFRVESYRLTLFRDGRALVEGTDDPERARAVFDRYVGS